MVEATYKRARKRVRTKYGKTDAFDVRVGVHQGSALNLFLFITIMDTLSVEIRTSVPWELIFADDIALMADTEEELQQKVINWQEALRKGELKMNTQKSKVLVTERHGETEVKVVDAIGVELKQVKRFKYLGTEIADRRWSNRSSEAENHNGLDQVERNQGVVCDRKMQKKLKCKLYKTVARPALMYGVECRGS